MSSCRRFDVENFLRETQGGRGLDRESVEDAREWVRRRLVVAGSVAADLIVLQLMISGVSALEDGYRQAVVALTEVSEVQGALRNVDEVLGRAGFDGGLSS